MSTPTSALRLGRRSQLLLAFTSLVGLAAFGWPLVVSAQSSASLAHSGDAPWLFLLVMPRGIFGERIAEKV